VFVNPMLFFQNKESLFFVMGITGIIDQKTLKEIKNKIGFYGKMGGFPFVFGDTRLMEMLISVQTILFHC